MENDLEWISFSFVGTNGVIACPYIYRLITRYAGDYLVGRCQLFDTSILMLCLLLNNLRYRCSKFNKLPQPFWSLNPTIPQSPKYLKLFKGHKLWNLVENANAMWQSKQIEQETSLLCCIVEAIKIKIDCVFCKSGFKLKYLFIDYFCFWRPYGQRDDHACWHRCIYLCLHFVFFFIAF